MSKRNVCSLVTVLGLIIVPAALAVVRFSPVAPVASAAPAPMPRTGSSHWRPTTSGFSS
jgi:hypothetical protein